ncbi:MAG: BrnA antitoxin family protein [Alphaproteobacteria bacterium]|nr:BrnA antitoxin family protein [Alphaproteobacteria bacterium]
MLDEEIAEDGQTAPPQRPPLAPSSPSAPAPARDKQAAHEPAREPEPKPEPQIDAAKPSSPAVSRTPGKRGRPKSANPKRQITLRLDAEVVDHFRAKGRGWQTRINSALRKAAEIDR